MSNEASIVQRMELTIPRDEVETPEGWEVTEDWHVDTTSPGDVEGA